MEETTNPLGESDAVDAIASLLDGPDDREPEEEVEEVTEEPQAETEETTEETQEETEETEETPEELEEITWEGETKKIPKTELKELAQKGFDYTQKTQQLAEARRQFEAQAQAVQQSIALQNQQIEVVAELKSIDTQIAAFKDVNWHQLAESDPVQYLKLNQTFRDLKESRDAKVNEFHQKAQALKQTSEQTRMQVLQREQKALLDAIPEFKGPKASEAKAKVTEYLKSVGFTPEEIGNVTDHRSVRIAYEAAQWRALQASKPQVTKRAVEAPKVIKAGTPKAQVPQANKDALQALRKTGRGEYAAKLIEQML